MTSRGKPRGETRGEPRGSCGTGEDFCVVCIVCAEGLEKSWGGALCGGIFLERGTTDGGRIDGSGFDELVYRFGG